MTDMSVVSPNISSAFQIQRRIIKALMLRDMKTRFGRSYVGYLIAIIWPLSHMMMIMGAQFVVGRVVPIGTDLTIFCATGILPYILCLYPARMMMGAVVTNKPLLLFSIVKTTDMLISRAILETLSAFMVAFIFMAILYSFNVDLTPIDTSEAIWAVFASIYVGIACGFLNAILFVVFKAPYNIAFIVITILLYATSGSLLLSSSWPVEVRDILWFNPMFQLVEWMRTAYYDGYANSSLSRTYTLSFATICLFLGLVGERAFRGRLYQS